MTFPKKITLKKCARIAAALAVAALVSPVAVADDDFSESVPETEKFPTVRTDFFSVSAETTADVNRAAELARETESFFFKTQRLWKKFLGENRPRVSVEIFGKKNIAEISAPADAPATLFLGGIFFDDAFTARAKLAEAALVRLTGAPVPAWIAAAAAEESRIGAVPGRRILFQKKLARVGPVSPETLITSPFEKFKTDEAFLLNAVWLLRATNDVSAFFDSKKTPREKLADAFPKKISDEKNAPEKFWTARFFEMLARAPAGVDLPEESRRAFDDALLVAVNRDGTETRVLAGDLVEFRNDEKFRELVAQHFSALAPQFGKTNPVWHNAMTELGVFLEMFADPEIDDKTLAAQWEKTLAARQEAIALQNDVSRAMRANENANVEN